GLDQILNGDSGIIGYCKFWDISQKGISNKYWVIKIDEFRTTDVGLQAIWYVHSDDIDYYDPRPNVTSVIYDAKSNVRGYTKGISNKYWIVAILEFFFGK
ncbi:MAG TPA: hypothetical protein VFH95_00890, partial [Candidatus Kapabacteria bacterium]|nr:hypothetical protein [Candidatus Kapabacteria bacterium]